MWFCFRYLLATRDTDVVALHDCDILTYKKEMLSRLVYPVANPLFPYVFSKGFYPRIHPLKTGRRVTRLLITPLVSALQKLCGPNDYLSFLESFRYPLAGEFSLRTHLLPDLRIPSDWGLEIGVYQKSVGITMRILWHKLKSQMSMIINIKTYLQIIKKRASIE